MHAAVSSLPPIDASAQHSCQSSRESGGGSKNLNWAVPQLMEKVKEKAKGEQGDGGEDGAGFAKGSTEVGAAGAAAYDVGRAEDMKAILESVGGDPGVELGKGKNVDRMNTGPG